jgi:hypothetical protein
MDQRSQWLPVRLNVYQTKHKEDVVATTVILVWIYPLFYVDHDS